MEIIFQPKALDDLKYWKNPDKNKFRKE